MTSPLCVARMLLTVDHSFYGIIGLLISGNVQLYNTQIKTVSELFHFGVSFFEGIIHASVNSHSTY